MKNGPEGPLINAHQLLQLRSARGAGMSVLLGEADDGLVVVEVSLDTEGDEVVPLELSMLEDVDGVVVMSVLREPTLPDPSWRCSSVGVAAAPLSVRGAAVSVGRAEVDGELAVVGAV
jgi:hypothetical protein